MSLTGFSFRNASDEDFRGIEELFERFNHSPKPTRGWTAWKYRDNPDGRARVSVAVDADDRVVATIAHMPRRFASAATGTLTVLQAVDIFSSPQLRQTGVFLKLLEFVRPYVDVPKLGSPNDYSKAFAGLPGWGALTLRESWHFPISVGRIFSGTAFAFIAPIANAVALIYRTIWLASGLKGLQLKPVARFTADYSPRSSKILGVRSAAYLNWRFIDNPIGRYSIREFFDGGEPIGFCVWAKSGSVAVISDFVAIRRERGCLRLIINHMRDCGIVRARFTGAGQNFRRFGFLRGRNQGSFIGYKLPAGEWLITSCDTDTEVDRSFVAANQDSSANDEKNLAAAAQTLQTGRT